MLSPAGKDLDEALRCTDPRRPRQCGDTKELIISCLHWSHKAGGMLLGIIVQEALPPIPAWTRDTTDTAHHQPQSLGYLTQL